MCVKLNCCIILIICFKLTDKLKIELKKCLTNNFDGENKKNQIRRSTDKSTAKYACLGEREPRVCRSKQRKRQ